MKKKVDIIVVNWNSGQLTCNALAPYINYEDADLICNVKIVDNNSVDNSKELFNKFKDINVIYNQSNVGFGKACNQAYQASKADYVLLLNPDTISEINTLYNLVSFLERNPAYGVVGPRQMNETGITVRTCGRFPTFMTSLFEIFGLSKIFPQIFLPVPIMIDWDHSQSKDVDHVMGSYMLIRNSLIPKIGFMDDSYFVYLEDLDFSKRMKDAGYKIFYDHDQSVFHKGGGTGNRVESKRLYYYLSARKIYWKKYLGKTKSSILITFSIIVEPFLRILDSIIKERKFKASKIFKAYSWYVFGTNN